MDSAQQQTSWILRRVGFGATGDDLDRAASVGIDVLLDELFEPDSAGVPTVESPFQNLDRSPAADPRRAIGQSITAWFDRMTNPVRTTTEWLAWYWHGHLVSSMSEVKIAALMGDQIDLFRTLGSGPLDELLRSITTDVAMLVYLDGARSTGVSPNENYGRELLELFSLGVGNYDERDVQAAAAALTGWTIDRSTRTTIFVPRRHDSSPHDLLSATGVNDVDSVIDAVIAEPACAEFITGRLAGVVLGDGQQDAAVRELATSFREDDANVGRLVRRLVERGLDGASSPVVVAPVPWLAHVSRVAGVSFRARELYGFLKALEQMPLFPPNVAGWPNPERWLSASATSSRVLVANAVADEADPSSAAMSAANAGDLDALAYSLGIPQGFSTSTRQALDEVGASGRSLLALALATPDLVIA